MFEKSHATAVQLYTETLGLFTAIKSLAYGSDGLFKEAKQNSVKFHEVDAAVALSVLELIEEDRIPIFSTILGVDKISPKALENLTTFLKNKASRIRAAKDPRELNSAVFSGEAYTDLDKLLPPTFIDENAEGFRGYYIITPAITKKEVDEEFEDGESVNVSLTLSPKSTEGVTEAATQSIQGYGLELGRLTGTGDSKERHVSLLLRVPYCNDLRAHIDHLNENADKIVVPRNLAAILAAITPGNGLDKESMSWLKERTAHSSEKTTTEIHMPIDFNAVLASIKSLGGIQKYIDWLNNSTIFVGKTGGKTKVVVPPDFRSEFSAVSLLDEDTNKRLKSIQEDLKPLTPEGNRLPNLHITQANKPVLPADCEALQQLARETHFAEHLANHDLRFNDAIEDVVKVSQTLKL